MGLSRLPATPGHRDLNIKRSTALPILERRCGNRGPIFGGELQMLSWAGPDGQSPTPVVDEHGEGAGPQLW